MQRKYLNDHLQVFWHGLKCILGKISIFRESFFLPVEIIPRPSDEPCSVELCYKHTINGSMSSKLKIVKMAGWDSTKVHTYRKMKI